MKPILIIVLSFFFCSPSFTQSTVEKAVPVKSGDAVKLDFKWPKLIKINTWDKNEIKIIAKVDINKGQNDDSFKIEVDNSGKQILISTIIEGYDELPHKIVIKKDGQEYFFNTDDRDSEEIKAFEKENDSNGYSYINYGVIMEITLEVWVPESVSLDVYSKFGMVELTNYSSSLKVHSKFGGIDFATSGKVPLKAGTKFGQKYTNLTNEIKPLVVGNTPGKWDWIQLGNKTEPIQELKSDFGNIYIRSL